MDIVDSATCVVDMVTRKEVARMLHISLPTLDKHTNAGLLHAYRIGHRVLYRRSEIIPALDRIARAEAASYD